MISKFGLGLGLGLGNSSGGGGIAMRPEMILEFNITSGDNITLPIVVNTTYIPTGKTLTVDWGDGTSDAYSGTGGDTPNHTYSVTKSDMRVKLSGVGSLIRFGLDTAWDNTKITKCLSFGQTLGIVSFRGAFWGCSNLLYVPNVLPPNVTNMIYMFSGANSFNQNIGSWNVSKVTDMYTTFYGATAFNQNIGSWNVSNVTDMTSMFRDATAFNQNIGSWNVSNVTSMTYMFYGAKAFNQNIGSWNVSNVTSMYGTFRSATAFNQNIGSWNVSNVTSMYGTFRDATAFNQNLANWKLNKTLANGSPLLTGLFLSSALSTANLELIIIAWAAHVASELPVGENANKPYGLALTGLGQILYDYLMAATGALGAARDYLAAEAPNGAGWTFASA